MNKNSLQGMGVLIPRPLPQGKDIAELIQAHAGTAIVFPVIEIADPVDIGPLDTCLAQLADIDLGIFVSVSAVNGFARRQRSLNIKLPANLRIAVVGSKTAKSCESMEIDVDFRPRDQFNSEGLLECMQSYNFCGKRVVIFRGQSGRERLLKEIRNLGARVSYVETYRRCTTTQAIQPIVENWRDGAINAVLVTSISILDNLIELLGETNMDLLKHTPVITISSRIADQCTAAGIENVLVSEAQHDQSMLEKMAVLRN